MSMHQGIDLSRFRKVSSDGKTTTLRHVKGHEIKIAHGSLTDRMREQINGMPAYMAENGEVPAQIPDPTTQQPSPVTQAQDPAPVSAQAPVQEQPAQVPAVPSEQPVQPQAAPKKTTADIANEMNAHDLEFQQMLAKGEIKPKTYHDLYEKKDTLGKIGTLFGLLVGGIGSGLTHQPNVVLEMMNKEISNDIEAQKQSKTNAENWYKMHMQHELNSATIQSQKAGNVGAIAEGEKTRAQTRLIPGADQSASDAALKDYNDTLVKGGYPDLSAQNTMSSATVQHLQDQVNKMPPGPQRDAAQSTLDTKIRPAVDAQIIKNNAKKAVIKNTATQNALSSQNKQAISSVVDNNKLVKAIAAGDVNSKNGIGWQPGTIDPNDKQKVIEEAGNLKTYHNVYNTWKEDFYKLRAMKNAGQIPGGVVAGIDTAATGLGSLFGGPGLGAVFGGAGHAISSTVAKTFQSERTAIVTNLKEQLARAGMGADRALEFAESVVPTAANFDDPKILKEVFFQGKEHFKINEPKIAPTIDYYHQQIPGGLKRDLEDFKYEEKEEKQKEPEKKSESKKEPDKPKSKSDSKTGASDVSWFKYLTPEEMEARRKK